MPNHDIEKSNLWASKEKEKIRTILLKAHPNPRVMLTFGGKFLKDALLFATRNGTRIRSVEHDRKTYMLQRKSKQSANIFPSYDTSSSYIQNQMEKEAPFDVVFLDYQGIYSKSPEDDIVNMFKCTFERGAIIGLTFFKGHDGRDRVSNTRCVQETCAGRLGVYKENRIKAISTTAIQIARENGYIVEEIYSEEYRNNLDKKHSGATMLFIMLEIKNIKRR